jgi:hypothetical protein
MTIDLEVQVSSEADRSDRSEPQGADREWSAESGGERDRWGDEQIPDRGAGNQGERASHHEALAIKQRSRRSGARAGTVDESHLGRPPLTPESATRRGDT